MAGQSHLLRYPEYKDSAFDVLEFLSHRDKVLEVIGSDREPGTTIYVGHENKFEELSDSSVIVTKYNIGTHTTGAIGLIGPVRLNYPVAVPYVEYFAKTLGSLLSDTYEATV
jgi:heat-inducible transcriptional repressor